jgi:hypothetical protein
MVTGPIFGALSIVAKGPGSSHRRTIVVEPSANPCIVALWWLCGLSVSSILTVITNYV